MKIVALVLLLTGLSAAKTRKHSTPSTGHASKTAHHISRKHHTRRGAWKRHGQQDIRDDRAFEIQQALIREKYLDGTPSGQWDARTQAAMSRYQADHGWQSKVTPDSRALIKLGLGPNHAQDMRRSNTTAAAATLSTAPAMAVGSAFKR